MWHSFHFWVDILHYASILFVAVSILYLLISLASSVGANVFFAIFQSAISWDGSEVNLYKN